jgi:hypothetical protein
MVKPAGTLKGAFKGIPIFPSIPKASCRLAKWPKRFKI